MDGKNVKIPQEASIESILAGNIPDLPNVKVGNSENNPIILRASDFDQEIAEKQVNEPSDECSTFLKRTLEVRSVLDFSSPTFLLFSNSLSPPPLTSHPTQSPSPPTIQL